MSSGIVNRTVNIFIESGEAQKVYDKLVEKQKNLTAEIAKNPKNVEDLRKKLAALEEPISRAAKKISGELSPSLKDTLATVKSLGDRLKRMSTEDADYSKVLQQYRQANDLLRQQRSETSALSNAQKELSNTNPFGRVLEFAKGAFVGGALLNIVQGAIGSITDFIKGSFDEAFQADENAARLKATLDNLGRSDAFDRLTKKASELADKFKYLDNDDINEAFNKLITYGKLTENQMTSLMPVIIDFAAKQRISIEEATDVFTKAMEGNAKALKTYGINIKDGSTTTERFGIIMTELKGKVDGAGEAFMKTAAGGVAATSQEFANLKEEIGTDLLPMLNKVLGVIGDGIKGLRYLFGSIKSEADQEIDRQNGVIFQVEVDKRVAQAKKLIETKKATLDDLVKNQQQVLANGKIDDSQRRIIQATIAQLSTKTLGGGNPDLDPQADKKAEAAAKKREEDKKKAAKEFLELQQELQKLSTSILSDDTFLEKLAKQNQEIIDKYQKLREKLSEIKAITKEQQEQKAKESVLIDKQEYDERKALLEKFEKEMLASVDNGTAHDRLNAFNEKAIKSLGDHLEQATARLQAQFTNDRQAHDQLMLMQKTGKDLLEEKIRQLHDQRDREIANTALTEQGKEDIRNQYQLREGELRKNFLVQQLQQDLEYAKQIINIAEIFGQAKTDKENAELERDRTINDKKKKNLDDRLKKGIISQQQYDLAVDKIEKTQEKREKEVKTKQFKRNQRAQEVQALMNGAMAVTSTLAAIPGPVDILSLGLARSLQIGLIIATTAAQVATIASQKPPQYARGGKLSGLSHRDGGMGVYDQYGRKQAEVEGGEAVVNRFTMGSRNRYTVSGTPSQIISELNGLYGTRWASGGTLKPLWINRKPVAMDFAGIPKRFFADGGVLGSAAPQQTTDGGGTVVILETLAAMAGTMNELQRQLSKGIVAKTYLTDLEAQQDRLNNIRKDATMKG